MKAGGANGEHFGDNEAEQITGCWIPGPSSRSDKVARPGATASFLRGKGADVLLRRFHDRRDAQNWLTNDSLGNDAGGSIWPR